MYSANLADKNNKAKGDPSPCNSQIYVCGINSKKEEEEENVDVVVVIKAKQANLGCQFWKA